MFLLSYNRILISIEKTVNKYIFHHSSMRSRSKKVIDNPQGLSGNGQGKVHSTGTGEEAPIHS
jgi:hypothetical protein